MGNAVSLCDNVVLKRQLTVLVVGLDNAGKTCASRAIVGETFVNVTPTIGFSKLVTKHRGIVINIYDLGGNQRIREIWHNYFPEAYGVVYVIDASDSVRMNEAQDILGSLMKNPMLKGKPFLLLANKQDSEQALDEIDVAEKLKLETLANESQTPTRIEICSATQGTGKQVDPVIRIGFQWLIESILQQFENINRRVSLDVAAQKEEEREERIARKERIRKSKEGDDQETNLSGDWNLPGSVGGDVSPTAKPSELIQDNSSDEVAIRLEQAGSIDLLQEEKEKKGKGDKERIEEKIKSYDKPGYKTLPPLRKPPVALN